jgi:hypothetical protein
VVFEVLGQVDCGHAAAPELALDPVAAGQGGREASSDVGPVGLMGGCPSTLAVRSRAASVKRVRTPITWYTAETPGGADDTHG